MVVEVTGPGMFLQVTYFGLQGGVAGIDGLLAHKRDVKNHIL